MGIRKIIIAFLIILIISCSGKEKPDAWKTRDNKTMAYVMMQNFVKEYLKSPGSAKFEWITEPDCKITKNGFEYCISSWVDSQNSFGSLVRTTFFGIVKQLDKDSWNLLLLEINDQEVYNISDTTYNDIVFEYSTNISNDKKQKVNKYVKIFLEIAPSIVGNKASIEKAFISLIEIASDDQLRSEFNWAQAIEVSFLLKATPDLPIEWGIDGLILYYYIGSGKETGVLINTEQEHYFSGFPNTSIHLVTDDRFIGVNEI